MRPWRRQRDARYSRSSFGGAARVSDLQLALIAFGIVVVAAVAIYNVVQERRARGRAEKAFGGGPPDALFDAPEARREPTLGPLPPPEPLSRARPLDETIPPSARAEELGAPGG